MHGAISEGGRHRSRAAVVVALGCWLALAVALPLLPPTRADAQASPQSRIGARQTTSRWVGALNTSSKAAVNSAYLRDYASNQSVSTGWLGNLLSCLLGQTSPRSNEATRQSLNFVRSLAGLAPVRFSSTMNRRAQYTALMMAANHSLDHHPSPGWRCYTPTGARTAGLSNLALAWPKLTSGQVIDLYMDDRGSTNTAVGHRRWLLNPFATTMGNGSTSTANALTVVGPSSPNRPNPAYVAWPTAGWFPRPMEPGGRWSLSAGLDGASFRHAHVRVVHNGHRVAVRKYPVHRGYAQRTIVWQLPAGESRLGRFDVTVTGIRHARSKRTFQHSYTVRIFTPER